MTKYVFIQYFRGGPSSVEMPKGTCISVEMLKGHMVNKRLGTPGLAVGFLPQVAGVTSSEIPKFLNPDAGPKIFLTFENPNLVQTLATIDTTEIQQCLYLRNQRRP